MIIDLPPNRLSFKGKDTSNEELLPVICKSSTSTMMLDFILESIMLFFGNYDINYSSFDLWPYKKEKTSPNPNIGRNQYTRLQLTRKMRGEV